MPQVGVPSSWQNSFGMRPTFDYIDEVNPNLKSWTHFTDWLGTLAQNENPWYHSINGAGASVNVTLGEQGKPGRIYCSTGTTNAGRAAMYTGAQIGLMFGLGIYEYRGSHRLNILSTAAEEYQAFIGFCNDVSGLARTDGAFFHYDRAVTGDNWFCRTLKGGVGTSVDSGVAVDTGWHTFRVVINHDATAAYFYIDGALVQTITTNIPGLGDETGAEFGIIKSVGATARYIWSDWNWLRVNLDVGVRV